MQCKGYLHLLSNSPKLLILGGLCFSGVLSAVDPFEISASLICVHITHYNHNTTGGQCRNVHSFIEAC